MYCISKYVQTRTPHKQLYHATNRTIALELTAAEAIAKRGGGLNFTGAKSSDSAVVTKTMLSSH